MTSYHITGCSAHPSVVALVAIGCFHTGCAQYERARPYVPPPMSARRVSLASFGYDGVTLGDGRRFVLSGLKMRTPKETEEPEGLDLAAQLVKNTHSCRIEIEPDGRNAILYYRQPVEYDSVWHASGLFIFRPSTAWATANELLIAMGLATYEPNLGQLPAP